MPMVGVDYGWSRLWTGLWTNGDVIVISGRGSHTPCFSLYLASAFSLRTKICPNLKETKRTKHFFSFLYVGSGELCVANSVSCDTIFGLVRLMYVDINKTRYTNKNLIYILLNI